VNYKKGIYLKKLFKIVLKFFVIIKLFDQPVGINLTFSDIWVKIILGGIIMIYTYKELKNKYKTVYSIKKAIKNKEIYKIDAGLYSNEEYVHPLVLYCKKYPNAVLTMDSAFNFYDLTDVIPQKTYLATGRHARKINNKKIVQLFIDDKILNEGKVKEKINGEQINIYDKERLLLELIRKRNQIPFDYYKEIISNYRKCANKLDTDKLEKYISLFKNESNLYDALIREVF